MKLISFLFASAALHIEEKSTRAPPELAAESIGKAGDFKRFTSEFRPDHRLEHALVLVTLNNLSA
jgi:hypothetical protein